MKVVRLILPGEKGIRPVRQHDPVLSSDNKCIGWVLSAAKAGENQIALAYVTKENTENNTLGVYYLARNKTQIEKGRLTCLDKNGSAEPDINADVISRFEKF